MRRKDKNEKKSIVEITTKKLEKGAEIAWYYGFTEIERPHVTKEDFHQARQFKDGAEEEKNLLINPLEKIALLRTYAEYNMYSMSQPVMLSFKKPLLGTSHKQGQDFEYGLEVLGSSRSIAEAVVIKAALAILEEHGFEETYVEVNSAGDKESIARFERELANYYRKNINTMPAGVKK